jgi:hypothetical protein
MSALANVILTLFCVATFIAVLVVLPDAIDAEVNIQRERAAVICVKHGDFQSSIPLCRELERHAANASESGQ